MLNGLRDRDTIVRWSSAKGLGRLAERLPKDLAQDVIGSVIELFKEDTFPITEQSTLLSRANEIDLTSVSDSSWHGACLAIAEMAGRGLLLPERLDEVVPWILKALQFDIRKGTYSVGAHVRDAACYVCWAFGRAYAPEIMKSHVASFSKFLVVVSCFDREVNIRRASSAAFQENVGRQGLFPHGIDIVTTADYFAVGNRSNSFLIVGVEIAKFSEYRFEIIDYVTSISSLHWDRSVRDIAAKSLHKLTFLDVNYMIKNILPFLLPKTTSDDLPTRHGTLIAIGEICHGISLSFRSSTKFSELSWWSGSDFENIIPMVTSVICFFPHKLLDSFGSEFTRLGLCHLINCLSQSEWPLNPKIQPVFWEKAESNEISFFKSCWDTLDSCFLRREESVQQSASEALGNFVKWFISAPNNRKDASKEVKSRIQKYIDGVNPKGSDKFSKRGFAMAFGYLPPTVFNEDITHAFDALQMAIAVQAEKHLNDAEFRRNATQSLGKIVLSLGPEIKKRLQDYSTDSRGDVGSWVREACIYNFEYLIRFLIPLEMSDTQKWLEPELIKRIIAGLLQQSMEKIDRVRETAGTALRALIWLDSNADRLVEKSSHDGLSIACLKDLRNALPMDIEINWLNPAEVYPRIIPLLRLSEYRVDILAGLVVSVGGLTESLVRHSSETLIEFLQTLNQIENSDENFSLSEFFDAVLEIFFRYRKDDRISIPLLEVVDLLIQSGFFSRIDPNSVFYSTFLATLKKEVSGSRDVKKLLSGINVFYGLALVND
ncbi:hypothetical protein HK096_004470, partial [Nowakowskiella sp. JEL0078]